jgi:RNA polymerase sigma-70 factor (ECF subfamily)
MKTDDELIPTRQSLLSRLKDWKDHDSWKVFFDTYWRLIYNAAVKAGLNDTEAQEVVQETIISVSKSMPSFDYKMKHGSFKSWLLNLTRWRIINEFNKRRPEMARRRALDNSTGTAAIERIPDPARPELEAIWDQEWNANLVHAARERVKSKVDPKMYQIFDLCAREDWPVSRVAQVLKVKTPYIYVAKHRVGKLLKKELDLLKKKLI